MRDRANWLNATMIELADTGSGELDESAYLGNFSERLAELLGPAEVCLLLPAGDGDRGTNPGGPARPARFARPARPDGMRAIAIGSGELAAGLSRLEADGVPGPCASCYRTGQPIRQLPLAAARSRWPEFTAMAGAAGLKACSALPMRRHQETIGAVSVLTGIGHGVAPADVRLARTLTEMATIGVLRQRELRQAQRLAQQLQCALDSRIVIEQAKGAVSAWLGVTPGDAFGLLRSYARARGRSLPQVAGEVLIGTVPAASLSARADVSARARVKS